jgi:two-component system chemotaxis response regulator CheY
MSEEGSGDAILVVDDSPSMREMIRFTLKSAGYRVIAVSDGVEAMQYAIENPVNLVVTDINMPNMDGITLIQELRKLESYKHTPILTLTTESGDDLKQDGKDAGATGWIVKPFDPDSLLKVIKRVL